MGNQSTITIDHLPSAPGIYKIAHAPSDSLYVGQAQDVRRRAKQHVDGIVGACHPTRKILRVVKKYGGTEGWSIDLIEACGEIQLDERESHWIEQLAPNLNTLAGRSPKDAAADVVSIRIDIDEEADAMLEEWARQERRSKREQASHVVSTIVRAIDQDPLIWSRIWVDCLSKLNVRRLS